jgi:hypothetical protein
VSSGGCARGVLVAWMVTSLSFGERARQQGGEVQVERPQPEARTNDLDAGAGWRTLDVEDDRLSCELASSDARSAPGSLRW